MEEIKNLKNLKLFFSNNRQDKIKNLRLLINEYRSLNNIESKKILYTFTKLLLDYIETNDITETQKFITEICSVLFDLCFLFPEILNDTMNQSAKEMIELKTGDEIIENKTKIINTSILVCFLTYNLKQTNQILTNYITVINIVLTRLNNYTEISNLILSTFLISILTILTENTNTYNPVLYNYLEKLFQLTNTIDNIIDNTIDNIIDNKDFSLIDLLSDQNKIEDENLIRSIVFNRLINITLNLIETMNNDINFDTRFSNIINHLAKLKNKNDKILNIIMKYNLYSQRAINKKNIPMTFIKLTRKAIPSIDPEYDFPPFNRKDDATMNKIIKKKTSATKKQAIRNLKKEGRVIDMQRQLVKKRMDNKRKEELKLTNQFIEQTKLEHKKMMTEQGKRRFKLKRGKTNNKN